MVSLLFFSFVCVFVIFYSNYSGKLYFVFNFFEIRPSTGSAQVQIYPLDRTLFPLRNDVIDDLSRLLDGWSSAPTVDPDSLSPSCIMHGAHDGNDPVAASMRTSQRLSGSCSC